jgi:2-iminobutanoate/2-iminopropanoate deaminase
MPDARAATGRISIEVLAHKSPIPAASRIGSLLASGAIFGTDPATGARGATLAEQCAQMFANLRQVLAAAGARPEDVIRVTVWMVDPSQKQALNAEWVRLFPDPHSRPARHTLRGALDPGMLVECDVLAVIGGASGEAATA